ncbi:MAG: response regulator [Calditrichaeota bacterium]|nr:response regulator [Calditrichota bacterium]MCB9365741.1 response regulator [Calditrichota bacterium]
MNRVEGGHIVRVLIADDNPLIRRILRAMVERQEGFEVTGTVADGDECVEAVKSLKPDVLSLDLEMPRVSGRSVLMKLLEQNARIGVVVVTGLPFNDQPSVNDELRSLGASAIIYKDFSPAGNDLGLFQSAYFKALRQAAKVH